MKVATAVSVEDAVEDEPDDLRIRVYLRKDSPYYSGAPGIPGTRMNEFGSEGVNARGDWARVVFDNGYDDCFRERDLIEA